MVEPANIIITSSIELLNLIEDGVQNKTILPIKKSEPEVFCQNGKLYTAEVDIEGFVLESKRKLFVGPLVSYYKHASVFSDNPVLRSEKLFTLEGRPCGIWKWFYSNKVLGRELKWNENGKKSVDKKFTEKGMLVCKKKYDKNGKKIKETIYLA